ncbi:MAG: hypothetical protein K6G64_00165 [Eubacterium sp.]|nr:hypothetical protein [Eubacterium sp.]
MKKIIIVLMVACLMTGCGTGEGKETKEFSSTSKYDENVVELQKKPIVADVEWKDGIIVKNEIRWKKFLENRTLGIPDQVVILNIFTPEDDEFQNCQLYFSRLLYDGEKFQLIEYGEPGKSLYDENEVIGTDEVQTRKSTFRYLLELSDAESRFLGDGNKMKSSRYYYLVDDPSLTFDDLMWSRISSNSHDWIPEKEIFWTYDSSGDQDG